MQCLFLDIASHQALVAAVTDTEVLASQTVDGRVSDDQLIPLVEQVLTDADWQYGDLAQVAAIAGPGGFTSLRIAVTWLNTMSTELKIPSAAIHLSDLYRVRTDEDAVWLHSTKREQLFVRGGKWAEPTLISLDELPRNATWTGELLEDHRALVELEPIELKPALDVLPAFLQQISYTEEKKKPWYGRGF